MRIASARCSGIPFVVVLVVVLAMAVSLDCSAGIFDDLTGKIPSIDSLVKEKPTITTSLKNAVTEVPFLDDFNPTDCAPMTRLPRGPHNGFLLDRPGLFEFQARSYCLHAGTYGPGEGEGYIYAPLAGPRSDIIRKIAQQSVSHPEVEQHDIQTLIWAVLARTKISDMSPRMQTTAAQLLSAKEIASLDGAALDVISESLMEKAMGKLSEAMRPIFEAESKLRSMLTTADSSFEELERVAVLVGDPKPGKGSREIPEGRWSYHPDGYFVRYFPSGYSRTRIQLYVPEAFTVERDSQGRITAVQDPRGNRIETEYDDQIEPVSLAGDSAVKGYAFRAIRFLNVRYIGPELMQRKRAEWKNVGWTLVGIPSGKGKATSAPERFTGLGERCASAQTLDSQVADLVKRAEKLRDGKGERGSDVWRADVMDLGHYAAALRSALAGSLESQDAWAADHLHLAHKAWQSAFCRLTGKSLVSSAQGSVLVASSSLAGILVIGSDDPCDNPPPKPENPDEFDPSGGAAMPGNTGRQRLLPSADSSEPDEPNPDCKPVSSRLNELQTIYDAFKNNQPRAGEDGDAYYKRILDILGYDESKGGVSPMGIDSDSCVIIVKEELYSDQPDIMRPADCVHEKSHQARCRWARDHATGGYTSWMMNASNYRQDEMAAYKAGMDALKDWQAQNGCN